MTMTTSIMRNTSGRKFFPWPRVKPNATQHNPSPDYLRSLIEGAGLSQRGAARLLGVGERTMRHYLAGDTTCPYSVQYALEQLVNG